ncbi:MAG: GAF domain-containing protein [Chloroflexi bacterium]|nr:GAF domain-containing protein [Chloroflexota bacterium]
MALKRPLTAPRLWSFLSNRAAPAVVFIYQLIALACFIAIPILAFNWLRLPFIGAFVEHTLMLNTSAPSRAGEWELQHMGLPFGYQIKAVNGEAIASYAELQAVLAAQEFGAPLTLSLSTLDGEDKEVSIVLQQFPRRDALAYLVIPYVIALFYMGSSIWVFTLRRWDAAGRAFALFTASVAVALVTLFDLYTTNRISALWTASIALAGGALVNLAFLFPEEVPFVTRYPWMRWIGYLPSLALAGLALPTLNNFNRPSDYVLYWRFEFIYAGLAVLLFLAWTTYRRYSSTSPLVKEQARLILWGAAISFGPIALWFLLTSVWHGLVFSSLLLFPLAVFPAVTAYAILRYRLLQTDYLLSQVTLYALLTALAASGYALLVSGLSILFGSAIPADHPLLIGVMIFFLAVLLAPLRQRLQRGVDAIFFRGQTVYRERLQAFGRELTEVMELPSILLLLRRYVQDSLYPSLQHIYVHDPLSDQYLSMPGEDGAYTTDIRFPANSPMVRALMQRRSSIFLGGSDTLPAALLGERARIALLGAQLFVPLLGQQRLVGWIGLGPRLSGEPYTNQNLTFLESLCDQAALAVERAQVVANLERRVHEMDALARVAQGVNITRSFDDILELVFAQTNQIIPTVDYHVTLRSPANGHYHAFYLENDERLPARENAALQPGSTLEQEVIQNQQALITDDYERECRSRNLLPSSAELFAWMAVPLNAGADTIGAISLASRDPAVFFTEQQLTLLQAIADQAAGAIVKARLLQETERRARQLAMLNEIGRSLTSTLETRSLLHKVLYSAVEILNCEAGSLFMVDQQTNELIFEVTAGPVAADLLGKRMPPGAGLVGQAAQLGAPIIANDVHKTQGWSDAADKTTGFATRDLLVVPMIVVERVSGVIEVINKKDGAPFNQDDQELLATFASQAAIALENARLYMQTDAALAARVDELSVMQRIDRELNATLDLKRILRITLKWSALQSGLPAGLVGLLDEPGEAAARRLLVYGAQGYNREVSAADTSESAGEEVASLELASLDFTAWEGRPRLVPLDTGQPPVIPALLPGARSQVYIPIRRQAETIGLLMLESPHAEGLPQESLDFLSRLSDHAAIAVSNAQLYSDLQAANLAKTEFVSLVSHELKTPMTSIRGYADLLAQGAAGPVNEIQANFLATIRSNVNRMATLVSDLADISRIEAGRMRLDFSAVHLAAAIQEVVRSTQAQIDAKKQNLELDIPADLPLVWGDNSRLIQVMANLLSNANKYTPAEGSILISAALRENQWDAQGARQVALIAVKDSGFGISPEDQQKIFQKFFRSEDQKVREAPGTGLGLNITRHLVEMQGGRIWFESELGKGTTFFFTIPVSAA